MLISVQPWGKRKVRKIELFYKNRMSIYLWGRLTCVIETVNVSVTGKVKVK